MFLLPQRNVPSSSGQMALQPLDQAHSWPTEPDLPPQPALSRGEGMDSWQLSQWPLYLRPIRVEAREAEQSILQGCLCSSALHNGNQLLQPRSAWDQVAMRPLLQCFVES